MPQTFSERLVALGALVAVAVLVLVAVVVSREPDEVAPRATPPPPQPATNTAPARPAARPPAATTFPEQATRPARIARLIVAATRGSCWVSIRAGSPDGESLFEGVLEEGRTVRTTSTRLWIRLGAAANVDLTLNGRPVEQLPAGTIDLVATAGRVQAA
jgi:hypothetical protein